jgi:3-oxoadipyl-CoA thiolase
MELQEVVVFDAVRSPLGKHGGILRNIRPDDLAAVLIKELINRNKLDPSSIEDVYFGCSNQAGEDNRNVARMAVLLSGLPYTAAGATVNRLCGSGLEAINDAANSIAVGSNDVVIAGGVESMTRAPYVVAKPAKPFDRSPQIFDTTIGWRFINPSMTRTYPPLSMGETAENLAVKYSISRAEQDEYALLSHRKAVEATKSGKLKEEIVPISVSQDGDTVVLDKDEGPRENTSLEALARLKPVFKAGGTVTAGNSSQISDGAAAVLLMSKRICEQHGFKPLAKLVASAVAGVDPSYMGIGPVPATNKLLRRTGLKPDQVDLVELNEAFSAQVLAVLKQLPIKPDRLNPNGGAIALGHPIGCSGARIVTTLLHEMRRRGSKYGLATLCIGVGQGIATLFERV